MMDGSMYPDGWHPCRDWTKPDFSGDAKYFTRTETPPRYYLIDFGLSRRHEPDDRSPKEYPILGGDKTVPEFKKSVEPCDPYPTDVYYIGNMVREDFINVSSFPSLIRDGVRRSLFAEKVWARLHEGPCERHGSRGAEQASHDGPGGRTL